MGSGDDDGLVRFEVVRNDLHRTRVVEEAVPAPAEGQVLLRVDGFGFTANNISYAVFGDALGYWQFFPAEGEWGQIPTWGFADVAASAHDGVPVGTRLFGYLPMASHLVLIPGAVDDVRLVEAGADRASLPAAYNTYRLTTGDPLYDPDLEDAQMLLWPLFFTGFVLDRFLAANDVFGARTVVLSSASSKTAIATAHCLAARGGVTVVGLTSSGNVDLVQGLGSYDEVVTYDDIAALPQADAVFVDFAGDTGVRAAVHRHYGDRLAHSALVGGTHWDQTAPAEVPGPAPVFFFAPDHWGSDAEGPLAEAWPGFLANLDDWLRIEHRSGVDAVEAVYREALDGRADPGVGVVLSL
jgi:Protein of unknown function (DUF2855)